MQNILIAKSVYKSYQNDLTILKNISLTFDKNDFIVLLGHSGSGKTTLLNVLSSILIPTSGQIFYKGQDITQMSKREIAKLRRNHLGFVFQDYLMLSNLTVRENILIGIGEQSDPLDCDMLSRFLGIHDLLDRFPYELSGGQQQRVAIARAAIKKPDVIFCDEATGALDEDNSKNIVFFLHQLRQQYGITVVFSTHNKEIAATANRVITLKDGDIVGDHTNEQPILPHDMNWGI